MFGVHSQLVADYFTPTPLAGGLYLSIVSLGRSHSPCKFDDIDINPEVIVQARAPLEIFDRLTQLAQTRRVGEINDENLPGASLGSWTICDAAQCGPGDDCEVSWLSITD